MHQPHRPYSPLPGAVDAEHAAASAYLPAPRLWRSRSNRVVAGVLGGLAEKFGWEPRPVRLLYGLFGLLTLPVAALPALVPYLALWAITRALGPGAPSRRGLWRSRTRVVVAGVLGGLSERLGWRPAPVRVAYCVLTAATMVLPGVVTYLVLWARTRPLDALDAAPRDGYWGADG